MIEQGTDDWRQLRLGKVTASRIADLMAKTKSGWGAGRANYKAQLIAERLTGTFEEGFKSAAMERGNEVEDEARIAYEFFTNNPTKQIAFVEHPNIKLSGASPDRLVSDDGLFEVKCPNSSTHIATILGASIKGVYMKQMMWQMACTDRKWCDFVSYDPRMPAHLQMHIIRVNRDENFIADIERHVVDFLKDVDETIEKLNGLQLKEAAE